MPKSAHQKNNLLHEFVGLTTALVVLSLSMFLLSNHFENQTPEIKVLGAESNLITERVYWENIVTQTPSYRDGWLELAKIDRQLGNNSLSKMELEKALEIDPNYIIPQTKELTLN